MQGMRKDTGLTRKYPLERHYWACCAPGYTSQDDSSAAAAGQPATAAVTKEIQERNGWGEQWSR
jgi:hypothetical protein